MKEYTVSNFSQAHAIDKMPAHPSKAHARVMRAIKRNSEKYKIVKDCHRFRLSAAMIGVILADLLADNLISVEKIETTGRPAMRYKLTPVGLSLFTT